MQSQDGEGYRLRQRLSKHTTATIFLTAFVLALIGSHVANANSVAGDYNFNACFGSWWSETVGSNVEAGMNDAYLSSSLGECKESRVEVRLKDGVFHTIHDRDILLPLYAEVDTGYVYISWTKHKSKDENSQWWTKNAYHNHY